MKILLFFGLVFIVAVGKVSGFPGGAPFDTCLTMYPKHSHMEQQTGPVPFTISLSPLTYLPDHNVTVTIEAADGHVIRGIQIRAHRADINFEQTVGMFVDWSQDMQPVNCFGDLHNMITHRTSEPRSNITLTWKAPSENLGAILFAVTLLESYQVFWAVLKSPRLEPVDASTVTLPSVLQSDVNTTFEMIDWQTCGKSKGCLLYPRHCSGPHCYAAVTFTKGAEGYTFEMFAKGEGYVSVGFSHDALMGDDQTVTCTAQGDRVTVQNGYNHNDLYNMRMMSLSLKNLQTMQLDGAIYCRFTRPESMKVILMHSIAGPPDHVYFDLAIDFYLFLAWGYTYQDSDAMKMHEELPIVSESKINFRRYDIYRGSIIPFYPKVHGCLMVVAWMTVTGLTVVLSRYFKGGVGANFCLGAKTWLQLYIVGVTKTCCSNRATMHRLSALLVLGLSGAGLAVILIHLKGHITEREESYNHACTGFAVLALLCAQVVFGITRPKPGSKVRFLFRHVHRILGKCAQILSAVSLVLAFQWQWMPNMMRHFALIVLYSWIGTQVVAEVLLEIWLHCCSRKTEKADISLDVEEPRKKMESSPDPSSLPILLYLLLTVAWGCAGLCSLLLF